MKRINSLYAGFLLLMATKKLLNDQSVYATGEELDYRSEVQQVIRSEIRSARIEERDPILTRVPKVFHLLWAQPGLAEAIVAFHNDLNNSETVLFLQQAILGDSVELQKLLADASVIGRYQQALDWHLQEGTPNVFIEPMVEEEIQELPTGDGTTPTDGQAGDTPKDATKAAYLKIAEEAEKAPTADTKEALQNLGKATEKKAK